MNSSAAAMPAGRKAVMAILAVIALILSAWALRAVQFVAMPLAFTVFIVMLLYPVYERLAGCLGGKLRWFALFVTMLILVAVLAVFVGIVWLAADMALQSMPEYLDKFADRWSDIMRWVREHRLPFNTDIIESGRVREGLMGMLTAGVASLWSVAATLVLVFFAVLLLMIELPEWLVKTHSAFPEKITGEIFSVVYKLSGKIRKFLVIRTFVSVLAGVLAGLWLWLVGVDLAFMWGVLVFMLNYLPYIGSIIAVFPPTFMALIQLGVWWAALALGGLVAIDQIIGNYIDPRLEGRVLIISPVVVLFSIIFWGWAWGVGGAILAVPITITAMIICEHIPATKPLAIMMGRGKAAGKKAAGG